MTLPLLVLVACGQPDPEDTLPADSVDDGGQSGATTQDCGAETRTPVTDPDAVPANENVSFSTASAAHAGTWTGTLAHTGEAVTFTLGFGTEVEHVYQETCGGWYEVEATVTVDAPSLAASFTGSAAIWGTDFAPITGVSGDGAWTTSLSPTGLDPEAHDAIWLGLRSWSEGDGGGRYYGYVDWYVGDDTPALTATTTDTTTTAAAEGTEQLSFFEAWR